MSRPNFRKIECSLVRLQLNCKTIAEYSIINTIRIKFNNIKILLNNIDSASNKKIYSYMIYKNCNKIYKAIYYIKDEQIQSLLYKIAKELILK